jgi:hypothetical protein
MVLQKIRYKLFLGGYNATIIKQMKGKVKVPLLVMHFE